MARVVDLCAWVDSSFNPTLDNGASAFPGNHLSSTGYGPDADLEGFPLEVVVSMF